MEDTRVETAIEIAKRLISLTEMSLEDVARVTMLPLEVIQKLANSEVKNSPN
ncbi:MAG: hypothetical protein K6E28_10225 [Eubacterium sp.]|nr:hypothetical protein [Eubacterium sp.]